MNDNLFLRLLKKIKIQYLFILPLLLVIPEGVQGCGDDCGGAPDCGANAIVSNIAWEITVEQNKSHDESTETDKGTSQDSSHIATAGEALEAGHGLHTGSSSGAVIDNDDGTKILLGPNTTIYLLHDESDTKEHVSLHIQLDEGTVFLVHLGDEHKDIKYDIEIPGTSKDTEAVHIEGSYLAEESHGLMVSYDHKEDDLIINNLEGNSTHITIDEQTFELEAKQKWSRDNGTVVNMHESDHSAWQGALEFAGIDHNTFSGLSDEVEPTQFITLEHSMLSEKTEQNQ